MTVFFQHVGERGGNRDFPRTIGTAGGGLVYFHFEDIEPYLEEIGADERRQMRRATEEIDADGFQIWGVPSGARTVLRELTVDDYLLLLESVGPGGSFAYAGRIIWRASVECFTLSRHLWGEGRFPIIVLMTGGLANYRWYDFCDRLGYKRNWNPIGNTYRLQPERLRASVFGDEAALIHRMVGHDLTRAGLRAVDDFELQDPAELDFQDEEGRRMLREHLHSERSARLVAAFKRQLVSFKCTACGFDFGQAYGELGHHYIECHHIQPVSEMRPGEMTRITDLVPLCANCHRMIHRSRPMKTIAELKTVLAAQFSARQEL
jgi:5-methylcytosine-specific restriction protein A